MSSMGIKKILLILSLVSTISAQAAAPLCQNFFAESTNERLQMSNFQETMALLTLHTGEKWTPIILEQMSVFESLKNLDSKWDLLSRFNLKKYQSSDGKMRLRWQNVDLSDAKKASKALVKMSRLIALEHFHRLRQHRSLFENMKRYKADTLERIEIELYLKALLHAEEHFKKSSQLSMFIPNNFLRTENVRLDQKMIDILNEQGLEAFHEAVSSRYGWRVGLRVVHKTSNNIMHLATTISAVLLFYFYQQGDDYFNKILRLETGLEGVDYNIFSEMLKESGSKSPSEVSRFLQSQRFEDADMEAFTLELRQELKK